MQYNNKSEHDFLNRTIIKAAQILLLVLSPGFFSSIYRAISVDGAFVVVTVQAALYLLLILVAIPKSPLGYKSRVISVASIIIIIGLGGLVRNQNLVTGFVYIWFGFIFLSVILKGAIRYVLPTVGYISVFIYAVSTGIETIDVGLSRFLAFVGVSLGAIYFLSSILNRLESQRDELVAAKEQSEQRGAELQSLLDRQKQMYAVIGHELRTPAASLQMILDTQDEQEELNKALIQANLQQLISVIDTLRAVAQPEKRVKGIYYDVLMDELLTQQLENFEPMAQQTKVRLHEDFEGLTVHPVRIQSTLVRQVVSNLIKNALIHSGASDITLQARAELLPERKKHLLIRVLDNGSGIPQETLKTLFKPFARGATHADGTGLGLYICKDLIENMGGTLRYLDNPGGGSCFEIDLTVDLADESANDVADEGASLLVGKSILLVEDNKTLQLLTEKLLTKQGASVVLANQGLEGLSHYQAGQFDLILSDIFMPEMNGYEFVSELRKRDCRLPIIGLTAATIGEEKEQMLAAGADVVMSKPMNITEVSKWLANFSR